MSPPTRPLKDLFLAALDVAPGDRAAWLDRECAADASLREHLWLMLAAHDAPQSLLDQAGDRPAADPWATSDLPAAGPDPGAAIGPYKLLEQIGEGGFGVVYLAEQTHPVRRRVALKVLKPGMDTKQVIARFEAERQALAIMDHPNIAHVFDGGTTPSGQPFFVMELVKGVPITDFCDQNHLPPRQRLELFLAVCQAVQHAHQKGVIHRDIKPSNVLVSRHDATPVVKVIDFGVAKALGQTLTDKTYFTGLAQMVGTPLYMSPEQAGMSDLDVDTRSDVYSLGVLLYELLTGTTPFARERFRKAAYDEMRRIIREEEPPKPSTRLSESKDSLPSVAAQRQTEPARLTKLVRGELDWIVMKALEKDRNRRYETANGFALDVQRYLTGEPVLAAPASQWYRLRKFVRRHRRPVVAAGLVLLALVGGITGTTLGLLQAERNASRAREERDAKDRALTAERQAREDETKARRQAFAALRTMTDNVILRKFAHGLGLTDDDREFLRGVIAQFDALAAIKGDDSESRALRGEGRLRVGQMRHRLGELREAEQDYGEALRIYQQLAADFATEPEFRYELAACHHNRAKLRRAARRPPEAENDYDQALGILTELAAEVRSRLEFRLDLARSLTDRGYLQIDLRRPEKAAKDFEHALSIYEQLADDFPTSPRGREIRQELATCHNNRGVLLREAGRPLEARTEHERALTIQKKLAADFPDQGELHKDVAHNCVCLAFGHQERGDWSAAKQLLLESGPHILAALKLSPQHPTYRKVYRNHLNLLTWVHAGLLEQEDAIRTAETCRDLGWDARADAYDAACFLSRCIPIVANHDKLDDKRRQEAVQFYGDAAMKMLRDAKGKGFRDVAHIKRDTDLEPLRRREDFQKLVTELE